MRDIIFVNGQIVTMNPQQPQVAALALRGEHILALGTEEDVRAQLAPRPEVVDLQGQCLLPGFHDSHVHLGQHGVELSQLRLESARTLAEGLACVRRRAEDLPAGSWILGSGFLMSRWGVSSLHKRDLDVLTPHHPVLLRSQDHHSAWANSAALKAAGIGAATANPESGEIVRDSSGEATGLLLEHAYALVAAAVPAMDAAALSETIRAAGANLASLGLTTVHHMAAEPVAFFREMASQASTGQYPLRIWACIPQADIEQAAALGLGTGMGGDHFQLGGAKFFADGALGSLTARMLEPFEGTQELGVEVDGRDLLLERIPLALQAGLMPVIHAIGDAANRMVLDVLAETQQLWLAAGLRPRVEHAQHLSPADIPRFAQLGVTVSMQPIHFRFDARRTAELLGERLHTTHAWQSLWRSGSSLALGSDTPVASPDVMAGLRTATMRQAEEGDVFTPEECLSIQQALEGYTVNAALAINWQQRSGQLMPGFDADLVILSHDPNAGLDTLSVKATMKAGRWTFQA